MAMTQDYFPKKRADKYKWWKNLFDHLSGEGRTIGLTLEEIAAAKAEAADQMAKMEAVDDAESALKGARAQEKAVTPAHESAIRAAIRIWKTKPAYPSSGLEGTLRLKGTQKSFDEGSFKPVVTLSIVGGQIKIDFTKGECDMVAIYYRLKGSAAWTRLGTDMYTPYYDTNPLAVAGVPEAREYMVMGVLDDEEVGQPSDIVSIVFGG